MASREDDFTAFAEAASSRLLNTAYLLCGDWHTAEDLTQTALARVFASWHRIREPDAVHAYARRTLLNAYFVDCRRTRRGEILIAECLIPASGPRRGPHPSSGSRSWTRWPHCRPGRERSSSCATGRT
jgi:DNA-directed RNA polymerase specialized sigma24 family protein